MGTGSGDVSYRRGVSQRRRCLSPFSTVEKGDRHRAGSSFGGFDRLSGSEPVPLFHSTKPTLHFSWKGNQAMISQPAQLVVAAELPENPPFDLTGGHIRRGATDDNDRCATVHDNCRELPHICGRIR